MALQLEGMGVLRSVLQLGRKYASPEWTFCSLLDILFPGECQ